jgi:hypothetical protein
MLGISDAVELSRQIAELVKKGITIDLQERITELREAVLNAKDETINLREEIQALKARVRSQEEWETRANKYSLVKTRGGAFLYTSEGPPPHCACPRCFQEQKLQILQPHLTHSGLLTCPSCKANFWLEPT